MRSVRLVPLVALLILIAGAAVPVHGEDAPKAHGSTGAAAAAEPVVAEPAPVRVTTSVEPKDVTIGTPFRFTLRVEADPGVEIMVPVLSERLGDFAIRDFGSNEPPPAADGTRVTEYWYELVGFEPGSQFVAAVPLAYRAAGGEPRRIEAPKPVVNIASLITLAGGADDVREIKDAVPIRRETWWWYALAGGLVAAALAGLGLFKLVNRRRAEAAAAVSAPHEVALEALARLQAERLVERGELERYYVGLSAIVRRYLEDRFGLRAPEMTTDEFLAAAQRNRDLSSAHRSALQEFLADADLVKFARHVPSQDHAARAWSAAHDFIAATRPQPEADRAAA